VICTNSTAVVHFPNIDRRKIRGEDIPSHCGRGHPLTPGNLRIDRSPHRWRCVRPAAAPRVKRCTAWRLPAVRAVPGCELLSEPIPATPRTVTHRLPAGVRGSRPRGARENLPLLARYAKQCSDRALGLPEMRSQVFVVTSGLALSERRVLDVQLHREAESARAAGNVGHESATQHDSSDPPNAKDPR
jgi:hypothetical protein